MAPKSKIVPPSLTYHYMIFEEIICRHSWPKALVHDQGTAFVNQLLEEFTRLTGMKNYQTAAMNPRTNGVSEA